MSDRKDMRRQIKKDMIHIKDILQGVLLMSEIDDDNNIGVAYTFTRMLLKQIHEGNLSPKAIERFLNEGEAE